MENGSKWNEKTGKCWRAARERKGRGEGDSDTYTGWQGTYRVMEEHMNWTCPSCWHVNWCCCCSFFSICSALIALFSLFQALKSSHLTFHFEQVITSRYLLLNCHKYCKCGKHNEYICCLYILCTVGVSINKMIEIAYWDSLFNYIQSFFLLIID